MLGFLPKGNSFTFAAVAGCSSPPAWTTMFVRFHVRFVQSALVLARYTKESQAIRTMRWQGKRRPRREYPGTYVNDGIISLFHPCGSYCSPDRSVTARCTSKLSPDRPFNASLPFCSPIAGMTLEGSMHLRERCRWVERTSERKEHSITPTILSQP